jgi:hypothetical protein
MPDRKYKNWIYIADKLHWAEMQLYRNCCDMLSAHSNVSGKYLKWQQFCYISN